MDANKHNETTSALEQIRELKAENERLKSLLAKHGITLEENKCPAIALQPYNKPLSNCKLSLKDKVLLFQSLFKGRNDVFAKRWHSLTGKAGYQPVCQREWDRQYCDKRKYRCADCPNRLFAPLTYEHLYNHLAGKDEHGRDVIGLYPILEDNTCHFLCADFDDKNCEHGYKNDVLAYVGVCKEWGIPCYIERSRSGNGAHVWIFFTAAITAVKARQLGNALLAEAMNKEMRFSFKSYDRLFPNQDTLPKGGFGNLVALPLQGLARRNGNSVFVDEAFNAYSDQWKILLEVVKITESAVDEILQTHNSFEFSELTKSNEVTPWNSPKPVMIGSSDFPTSVTLTKANMLYIPLEGLSPKAINLFKRIAAFRNPEFYAKQAMRLPTYAIPRIISCSELTANYLALPRGCEDDVQQILRDNNVSITISDHTCHGSNIDVRFTGTLREEQQEALNHMLVHETGTFSATTAFGKTVLAIAMIAQRKVNTLVLVHRRSLLDQWRRQLETFLAPIKQAQDDTETGNKNEKRLPIGQFHSGKDCLSGVVDIAMIQSCLHNGEAKAFVQDYGMIIVDECHHVPAVSFEQVLRHVKARYVYGLTATPFRKEGHQPIIFMQCGKIRYTVDAQSQIDKQEFTRRLIPRFTSYRTFSANLSTYAQMIEAMSTDEQRNRLIVEDVKTALSEGRTPLVLSSLTVHVRQLARLLSPFATHVITLIGADSAKNKRLEMEQLKTINPTDSLVIVATGKYVGEGFDYPRLDTLFLTLPISWKGSVAQYAGRLHRDSDGKHEVCIYDYVDIRIPLCENMYRKRLRGYAAVGYSRPKGKITEEQTANELLFNATTYLAPFKRDLIAAQNSILVACPKLRCKRTNWLTTTLNELQRNGIEVALHTNNMHTDDGKDNCLGMDTYEHEHLSVQCAIIDHRIVWYGDINLFGQSAVDSSIMRICDTQIANQLLDAVLDTE